MAAAETDFCYHHFDVCHCGAGCVLGDVVGEWLVYGTNATINGRLLWTDYLVGE